MKSILFGVLFILSIGFTSCKKEKLVVKEGEKVWTVIIDIYPINDDGNLIDAATIGAVCALKIQLFQELQKKGE